MIARVNDNCISCGVCVDISPDVFELGDGIAVVKISPIPQSLEESVKDAEAACPVEAIDLE